MTSYITGLAGTNTTTTTQHFVDNHGQPKLYVTDYTMGLLTNAGKYSSGAWQSDIDSFFSARAAQGTTVHHDVIINCVDGAANVATGGTWDNVAPFNSGGDPTTGLNSTFWGRVDYLINSAASNGITVAYAIGESYNWPTGKPYGGWTTGQFTAFAAAVGARYPSASWPNLMWFFGDDDDPGDATIEGDWDTMLTALRTAGANHLVGVYWETETTSRYDPNNGNAAATWGVNNASFNCVYTYQAAYWMMEYAYEDVSRGSPALLPSVSVDGEWYQGSGSSYYAPTDRQIRQIWWWTLSSGSRGFLSEANNVYAVNNSSWLANVTIDWVFVNNQPNVTSYFSSLPQWYNLIPDLSSALVTAGRGTHLAFTTAQYGETFTNNWVSASKTPDGALAILYMPNAATVTVNTALLAGGSTATWVDPVNCTTHATTLRASYNSGAADGSKGITNSQGDPDWVLVFQGPAQGPQTSGPPVYGFRS